MQARDDEEIFLSDQNIERGHEQIEKLQTAKFFLSKQNPMHSNKNLIAKKHISLARAIERNREAKYILLLKARTHTLPEPIIERLETKKN